MTAPTREAAHEAPTRPPAGGFRPELQGLRAVAVLLVVVYHLWPNRVTGGYVGVDVFFVISGYLITSHLHRELSTTGTVSLSRFWARRARRLLPASLLVLVVSGVGVLLLMPATVWEQTARQIGASALYVQNWALAADAVDYMAADAQPTVAQHYWSLSVEEQFYLFWPVLLLGLAVLGRRAGWTLPVRAQLAAGITVVLLVSLVWSVLATYQDQASAYFITPTRIWELAAGGLLALVRLDDRLRGRRAVVLAWVGLAAVAWAGFTYDDSTLFPGYVALLPVLGTMAVMAAGTTPGRASVAHWLSKRPLTFIGDISYSVYLWHWPLIVLWPFATGGPLGTLDKLAVLGTSLVLAWLSKILVEDPARTGRLLRTSARTYGLTALGMTVVLLGSLAVVADVDRRADAAAEQVELALQADAEDPCVGPSALTSGCEPPEGDGDLVPPPEVVAVQNTDPPYPGCQQSVTAAASLTCVLGDTSAEPSLVVALVGDSHATMWFPALEDLALERGWQVHTFTKSSCPLSRAVRTLPTEQNDDAEVSCRTWVDGVMSRLQTVPDLSVVLTAAYATAYGYEAPPGVDMADPRTEGFTQVWDELAAQGLDVVALSDVPRTLGGRVPDCLAANPDDRMACAVPREEGLPGSALVDAASRHEGVTLVDLDDQFCDDTTCYPVVGDLVVYRDYSHLSAEYSRALAPLVGEALERTR